LGAISPSRFKPRTRATALGELMGSLAPEIEADRQTLIEAMERLDTSPNPVKRTIGPPDGREG